MRFTTSSGRKQGGIITAEKAIGKELPAGAIVHHVNENKADNRNANLVVCQDRAYHNFIHKRMRAVESGFPPHYRKCAYCHSYDDPQKMTENYQHVYHCSCVNEYQRQKRKEKCI
jgi:hypothetical protein